MVKDVFNYHTALNYLMSGGEINDLLEMHHPTDGWIPVINSGVINMRVNASYRISYRLKEKNKNPYTHEEIMTKWCCKTNSTVWAKFTAYDNSKSKPMYEYNNTYWISYDDICREFVMSENIPR